MPPDLQVAPPCSSLRLSCHRLGERKRALDDRFRSNIVSWPLLSKQEQNGFEEKSQRWSKFQVRPTCLIAALCIEHLRSVSREWQPFLCSLNHTWQLTFYLPKFICRSWTKEQEIALSLISRTLGLGMGLWNPDPSFQWTSSWRNDTSCIRTQPNPWC